MRALCCCSLELGKRVPEWHRGEVHKCAVPVQEHPESSDATRGKTCSWSSHVRAGVVLAPRMAGNMTVDRQACHNRSWM
jgi:hypothetical protein